MDEQMIAREAFESWARNAVPQFSASGKHVRGGEWSYNHNIVELMWQCWRAAHSVMAGKVAELADLLVNARDLLMQSPHIVSDEIDKIDAALAPYPERRSE